MDKATMKLFDTEYELRDVSLPDKDEHNRRLGDFVSQFAGVESAVYILAQTLIDDPAVAACVLRDVQLSRVIELTREIARAKHGASRFLSGLDAALLKIKHCTSVRNRLLHSMLVPIQVGTDGPLGLWAFSARRPAMPRETLDDLARARSELDSAAHELFMSMMFLRLIKVPPEIAKMLGEPEQDDGKK